MATEGSTKFTKWVVDYKHVNSFRSSRVQI